MQFIYVTNTTNINPSTSKCILLFFGQNTQFLKKKVPFIRDLEIQNFDGSWDKLKNSSIPKLEPLHAKAAEKSSNMLSPKPVRTAIVYIVR